MNWDPLQREVLETLGHALYRVLPPASAIADDPLLHALLRAAGRSAESGDAETLCRAWMPVAPLRGNAAGKRALWPQLRALRKPRPS